MSSSKKFLDLYERLSAIHFVAPRYNKRIERDGYMKELERLRDNYIGTVYDATFVDSFDKNALDEYIRNRDERIWDVKQKIYRNGYTPENFFKDFDIEIKKQTKRLYELLDEKVRNT